MELYQADNTKSATWLQAEKYFRDLQGPSKGKISHAANLSISPDATKIAFTGSICQSDLGLPSSRICLLDVHDKSVTVLTDGPNDDKEPQWSRDGHELYFLSDRKHRSSFQLCSVKVANPQEVEQVTFLGGSIESFAISPTSNKLLLGLASLGSDRAGSQGSGTVSKRNDRKGLAEWMPSVEPTAWPMGWRSVWVCDIATWGLSQINESTLNVWESTWCGDDHIIALASDTPDESAWYSARLEKINISDKTHSVFYNSPQQVSHMSSSPSATKLAFVEALCSDRTLVAGRLRLFDHSSGNTSDVVVPGVNDVVQTFWLSESRLLLTGYRGLDSVIAELDLKTGNADLLLETPECLGMKTPKIASSRGIIAVLRESWTRYPEIARIRNKQAETLVSFDHPGAVQLRNKLGIAEQRHWLASDGEKVEGMLYLPLQGTKPYPLIVNAHGGPVASYRDTWQGYYPYVAFLVANGYAVLNANPRGSTGRGRVFAEAIKGDYGGKEATDLLEGVDYLVNSGLADPKRLGVTGGSHGGYLAAWLVTQTNRFAASIPRSPVTDYLEHYLTSNIPAYMRLFVEGSPYSADSQFFSVSPLRFIEKCTTPVLQIVGSEDRCVHPAQARQFHRALLDQGVTSVIVEYPQEAHGVRQFPAYVDFCHRMLLWFQKYMPA